VSFHGKYSMELTSKSWNFQNSVPKVYLVTPIDVVVFKFRWNLADGLSAKSCVAYVTKKNSAASQTVATARIAPKICHGQPPTMYSQCSRFHPNRSTFGGDIDERMNTVFCPVEYFHRLFEPIKIMHRI